MSKPLAYDSRPRFRYVLPDGRVIRVILDHGDEPEPMTTFEVAQSDTLYASAQRCAGSKSRRYVLATLVEGL